MATNRWLGDAPAVARVITLTVAGTPANGDTISYTIGNATVTFTLDGSDTAITAASGLYDLLAASEDPRFKEIDWSYTTGDAFVTGTAATAGVYFDGTAADTGTTTLTEAEVTASTGPSHVDEPLNWSLAAVPGAGDDVLIDQGADILYGFDAISAAAYTTWKVKASFGGNIGLPFTNSAGYVEYRTRAWPMATAVPCTIGEGEGDGPTRVIISQATVLDLTIVKTGTRPDPAVPVVIVYGHSSGTLNGITGDVGIAADDDTKTGTTTTATVNDGAVVVNGPGATITTLNQRGAQVTSHGTVTTLNATGPDGVTTLYKNPTTITADAGLIYGRFTGTVTTLTLRGQPEHQPKMDFSLDPRARTVTNHSVTGGAILHDPDNTITFSNAGTWDYSSLKVSHLGERFSLLKS